MYSTVTEWTESSVKMPFLFSDTASAAAEIPTNSGGDGRNDLMAAIRNAGGAGKAKLKRSKERKLQKKAAKEQTSSGGDLMSDLFAKLQMRRKGISGSRGEKSANNETGGGSAMDKISSMIPPPNNVSSLANDSGEWDS